MYNKETDKREVYTVNYNRYQGVIDEVKPDPVIGMTVSSYTTDFEVVGFSDRMLTQTPYGMTLECWKLSVVVIRHRRTHISTTMNLIANSELYVAVRNYAH